MSATSQLTDVPAHIPPELVVDFDLWKVPDGTDVHENLYSVMNSSPPLFWTPRNGGHWLATRFDDVKAMLGDSKRFSSRRAFFPRDETAIRAIPIEFDAPEHTEVRRPLQRALFDKRIDAYEPEIVKLIVELIEELKPKGNCEFINDFANVFPLCVFLDLVNLPREDRHFLRIRVEQYLKDPDKQVRDRGQRELFEYLGKTVMERRANPGDDLASLLVNAEWRGGLISPEDATNFLGTVMFAGLDTVASSLGFIIRFLGTHPEHRKELAANAHDEKFVQAAMDEFLRRFGLTTQGRIVAEDHVFNGVKLAANDTIIPMSMLCGLDNQKNDDPLRVDFKRGSAARHLAFSTGPHMCPGQYLARRELRVFLREWMTRIPDFEVEPGFVPKTAIGITIGYDQLPIRWPKP